MSGFVVWMTGLSGAGKSTLATRLTQELSLRGVHVECLDGDEVRKNLSHGLGFSREDRDRNVRRIGYVARMVARSGACAITAAISPYRALRDEIRSKTENFFEVYCECPLDVLTERDPKGLYKRALAGEIKNFTGVDDPYEAPADPEVHLRTDLLGIEESLERILSALTEKGLLGQTAKGASALPPPFGGEVFEARLTTAEELKDVATEVDVTGELGEQVRAVSSGYFCPVTGFMTQREAVKVEKSHALERGTPWWSQPFVLPVPGAESDFQEGQLVALRSGSERIAVLNVEQVWNGSDGLHLAGQLEAVTSRGGCRPTAREFRRIALENGAKSVASLFCAGPPTEQALLQVRTACGLVDAVALGIPEGQRDAWEQSLAKIELAQTGGSPSVFELPKVFPFGDERARLVVQKSLGASANALVG